MIVVETSDTDLTSVWSHCALRQTLSIPILPRCRCCVLVLRWSVRV